MSQTLIALVVYYAIGLGAMWWAMHRFLRRLWGAGSAHARFTGGDWLGWAFFAAFWPILLPVSLALDRRTPPAPPSGDPA